MPSTTEKPIFAQNIALRSKQVSELRSLAVTYLDCEPDAAEKMDKVTLLAALSKAVKDSKTLADELKQDGMSLKPSFYVVTTIGLPRDFPPLDVLRAKLDLELSSLNSKLSNSTQPQHKGFQLLDAELVGADTLELQFVWQNLLRYWHPTNFNLTSLYTLQVGFVLINRTSSKALVCCHTVKEREHLSKVVSNALAVTVSPLVFTRELLNDIGSFDFVKKAAYFCPDNKGQRPENIIYADEGLSTLTCARELEEDGGLTRTQSFYRIDIGAGIEQGVGATSNSGKLWIPRETSIDTLRTYGMALLKRIGKTMRGMVKNGEIDAVLDVHGVEAFPEVAEITPVALRKGIVALIYALVNMVHAGSMERPFTVSESLLTGASPNWFFWPRLTLHDTDLVTFWHDSNERNDLQITGDESSGFKVQSRGTGQELDVNDLVHPLSGEQVQVDLLDCIFMLPTRRLHEVVLGSLKVLSSEIKELGKLKGVYFHLEGRKLKLDLKRSMGTSLAAVVAIEPDEIQEFQKPLSLKIDKTVKRDELDKTLRKLGEKCSEMSNDNCRECVKLSNYACIRTILARFLRNPLLLAHKGIELSDLQGEARLIDGDPLRVWSFAKLAAPGKSLTARNDQGAVLQAQIIPQLSKSTFDTVLVLTPSPIEEDLRESLLFLCNLTGKRVVFVDREPLSKMLLEYERQVIFDGHDLKAIYAASKGGEKAKPKLKLQKVGK